VYAHVIRRHAAGIADVFAAADHVDEDQDDEDDGRDPSAVVPCLQK
jgi:integrase